jgi:hypothetical protein
MHVKLKTGRSRNKERVFGSEVFSYFWRNNVVFLNITVLYNGV